jgi:exosortase E/protease (VPEID-CTERM system)
MSSPLAPREGAAESWLSLQAPQTLWRVSLPVSLFVLEAVCFHANLKARIGSSFVFTWVLVFLAVFVFCGVLKYPEAFRDLLNEWARSSIRVSLLAGHLTALLVLIGDTWVFLYAKADFLEGVLLIGLWYLALLAAMVCGALAFLPWPAMREILRRTGLLWLYAAVVGLATNWVVSAAGANDVDATIWLTGLRPTFFLVKALLHLFTNQVVADPVAWSIGTERFTVKIGYGCTGIEGISLMLVFGVAWLFFFRAELRFPRCLLLLPASVVLIYLLNTVRIASLILIGHAGAPEIAVGGFHSNSGWIFFTCVALGLVYAAQSRWLRSDAVAGFAAPVASPPFIGAAFAGENSTAVYLAPLLAILATAMLTRAVSAGFDWLYPLRFVAVAAVLWIYRRRYRELDWRFSIVSVLLGVAVFVVWVAPDFLSGPPSADAGKELATGLAGLSVMGRAFWMTFRILGATLTVPIAEELAFRGFALRRLQAADFESVNWRSFTWLALAISSLVFGLTHGDHWVVGTVAGLVYAAAMLRRGRIGDAAVAHATTNALLAVWVISRGAWYLW